MTHFIRFDPRCCQAEGTRQFSLDESKVDCPECRLNACKAQYDGQKDDKHDQAVPLRQAS
jgi:hypothetical protein